MKKIQKKQLKEGGKNSHHGGIGGSAGGNKNHNANNGKGGNDSQDELSDNESAVVGKLSLRIKDENSRSNNYLHDSCSDNEGTVTDNDGGPYGGTAARLGLGGQDPYKIVKEELDLEDDYFRMAMATPNHLNHHHNHHHHHHNHHPQQQQQQQQHPHPQPHHPHATGGGRFGGKSFANDHHANTANIKTENMTLDTMLPSSNTIDYGASLQQLATSINGGTLGSGTSGNGVPPGNHDSIGPMLNPIDRLYSMQNSYFCNQESQLSCPTTPTGLPGTPPGGNHHRPAAGSGPPAMSLQQPSQIPLQHHGLQQQQQQQQQQQTMQNGPQMPPHHFQPNGAQNMVNLGVSNLGAMGPHLTGLCNPMLEQQQQQESVM
uniref:Uncharacterized protein n=1 Tax=Anopheles farauti TaxID=69004 RepID=A0A182QDV0_9DIPT